MRRKDVSYPPHAVGDAARLKEDASDPKPARRHSTLRGRLAVDATPKPLYPGLYGWQVAYRLPDASVAFCCCFREAWFRYFLYLRDELPASHLRTHREKVEGKRLLKLAFSKCARGLNSEALKALFPGSTVPAHDTQIVDGKEFFFGNDDAKAPELDEGFWDSPQKVFRFEERICDVCRGRVPNHYYCHQMYGSPFLQVYGAWAKAELIRQGYIDWLICDAKTIYRTLWKDAENKIRGIVGVPPIGEKFISETVLFKTIAYLLTGHDVIHHYRADWLHRQELDIFVPSLNLAVEYQGEQHYIPIDAWGGEEALEKTQQRDEEKRRKCDRQGITLVFFDHTMNLTEGFVAKKLESLLAKH